MKVLLTSQLDPSKNGTYEMNSNNKGEGKMKVIIEFNENVRIESNNEDDNLINIFIGDFYESVNIDDLRVALRKMTAK